MNLAHVHLLLNHIPVLGTLFAFMLLAWGAVAKSRDLTRAGLVFTVLAALVSIPTSLTGDPAADAVKGLPGVTTPIISEHEEAADYAFYFLLAVGALALAALAVPGISENVRKKITTAVLVGMLLASAMMGRTAYLGGMIRHTEVRPGAVAPPEM